MDNYNQERNLDRRVEQQPVDFDRRLDMNARVSVLEVQINNNSQRMDDHVEVMSKVIDRLDTHIQASTQRDHTLQNTMGQITVAVTTLSNTVSDTNSTLKDIAKMATESNSEIMKWNTVIATLAKIVTGAVIIIGAAWSVFTFIESNHPIKVTQAQTISQPSEIVSN